MSTQRQVRGASAVIQAARTLVSRVLDVNTTKNRIYVHDGSTVGGIPHINAPDFQNQEFISADVTGTNALVMTLPFPITAYLRYQSFVFRAAQTNTGSVTLNIDGIGAVVVKKISGSSIKILSAGDLLQFGLYRVTHDGSDFILQGGEGLDIDGLPDVSVAAADMIAFLDSDGDLKKAAVQQIIDLAKTSTSANVVGTHAMAYPTGSTQYNFGNTISGANLKPCNVNAGTIGSTSLAGTWRCLGVSLHPGSNIEKTTLWVRIS
ncbi:MAG: hypothetical protein COA45_03965 [Zetaproteobacteria bacterium]|nr:MAG: hypothetical protein COA45_03965 [Zetaproteobacteria bacterium]